MAGKAHTPSRRALLGALPAMAAIGTVPALAELPAGASPIASDGGKFARRMAAYDRARDAAERFHAAFVVPADALHERAVRLHGKGSREAAETFARSVDLESRYGELVERYTRRLELALVTPATTLSAVAVKLTKMSANACWDWNNIDRHVQALLADVRRLGGEG